MPRFSKSERDFIFQRDGGICVYCNSTLNRGKDDFNRDKKRFTVDHIKSLKSGGNHSLDNAAACCRSCNSRKGNKCASEYIVALYTINGGRHHAMV